MITIDQLLESVDLDFEPRWVTKDMNGTISIYVERPQCLSSIWASYKKLQSFAGLKVAEFENKDWTECIYEVPRKTTGKIEKINKEKFSFVYSRKEKNDIESALIQILDKQAELVDAVNKHADIIQQIGDWGTRKGECLWCEKLTKFEPNELKGAKNE